MSTIPWVYLNKRGGINRVFHGLARLLWGISQAQCPSEIPRSSPVTLKIDFWPPMGARGWEIKRNHSLVWSQQLSISFSIFLLKETNQGEVEIIFVMPRKMLLLNYQTWLSRRCSTNSFCFRDFLTRPTHFWAWFRFLNKILTSWFIIY